MDGDDLRAVGRRDRRRHRSQEGSGPRRRERVAVRRGHRQRTEDLVAGRGPASRDLGRVGRGPGQGGRARSSAGSPQHATTRVGPRGPAGAGAGRADRGRGDPALHVPGRRPAPAPAPADQRPRLGGRRVAGYPLGRGAGHASRRSTGSGTPRSPPTRSSGRCSPRTGSPSTPRPARSAQLAPYVGAFSARTAQIRRNIDRYEAEWRREHPGEEPGPRLRRGVGPAGVGRGPAGQGRPHGRRRAGGAVERRAARPRLPRPGRSPCRWLGRRSRAGSTATRRPTWSSPCSGRSGRRGTPPTSAARSRSCSPRPAWSPSPRPGSSSPRTSPPAPPPGASGCSTATDVPEHVRSLTSPAGPRRSRPTSSPGSRAAPSSPPGGSGCRRARPGRGSTRPRRAVVGALAGDGPLVVVEGAAGAGQDHRPARRPRQLLAQQGHRLVVVTPTLKAAEVAAARDRRRRALRRLADPPARLALGQRRPLDPTTRPHRPTPAARLRPGDLLLVDEAGMLDQDTARALLTIADETGARVALVGDRHQLPAVGRGGVLDHAVALGAPDRGRDPGDGAPVHRPRLRRAHPADAHRRRPRRRVRRPAPPRPGRRPPHRGRTHRRPRRRAARPATSSSPTPASRSPTSTPRSATSAAPPATRPSDSQRDVVVTARGERIGLGDRVATRRNDPDLGSRTGRPGPSPASATTAASSSTATDATERSRPSTPRRFVELAYATTVHGAQGDTVDRAHVAIGDTTGAAAAYVAMTRGRDGNTAHLVAEDLEDARRQWVEVFARDRADLGPAHAEAAGHRGDRPLRPRAASPTTQLPGPAGNRVDRSQAPPPGSACERSRRGLLRRTGRHSTPISPASQALNPAGSRGCLSWEAVAASITGCHAARTTSGRFSRSQTCINSSPSTESNISSGRPWTMTHS